MIPANLQPLANHLWQSTVFALPVALLALALRKNRAAVRYWLWLAASVKFLIPFSLLVEAGRRLEWRPHPAISQPQFSYAVDQIARPFAMLAPAPPHPAAASAPVEFSTILLGVWLCGAAVGAVCWFRSWRRIHAAKRSASPLYLKLPIPAFSTPGQMEPGVFGIRKPVLLLPEGILDRLTPAQLEAVFAHELCHVRRRDNLMAAIHTVVETIFWFHPLVWWIRARLVEEREHACDEEVLGKVGDAQDYAEGILNVCKLYLESPLRCVSGVMGSNLKKRVHSIIYARTPLEMNFRRKILLGVAGFAVVAGPVAVGIADAPRGLAQSTAGAQTAQPSPSAAGASKASSSLVDGSAKAQTNTSPTFEVASVSLPLLLGQSPATPAFEVTSVKRNTLPPGERRNERSCSGKRFIFRGGNVSGNIAWAYQLVTNPALGLPEWATSRDHVYDIEAMAEGDVSEDQCRLMLQTLLADRFKLKVHWEPQETPVYALVVAKGGLKMQEATSPASAIPIRLRAGKVQIQSSEQTGGSMEQLARALGSARLDRPVVNGTGVEGVYKIDLEFRTESASEDVGPDVRTALGNLGLKLEARKDIVKRFVVDHVEEPDEN